MTASIKSPFAILTVDVSRIIAVVTIACIMVVSPQGAYATEPCCSVICGQSAELKCTAEEMRDDLKCNMRGSKGYAKMLVVNARIKIRSAAVHRRVDRNPCYRGLDRDVQKLNELTCELVSLYDNAVLNASAGCGKPICGSTVCIAEKLTAMVQLTDSMKAASLGLVPVFEIQDEAFYFSEIDPNQDARSSVPSVVVEKPIIFDGGQPTPAIEGPAVDPPIVDPPQPNSQSVLEE